MSQEPKIKLIKRLANGAVSKPACLRTGEWVTVSSFDELTWYWHVNVGRTHTVPGMMKGWDFVESLERDRKIVETYRRGQGFSEGMMTLIEAA